MSRFVQLKYSLFRLYFKCICNTFYNSINKLLQIKKIEEIDLNLKSDNSTRFIDSFHILRQSIISVCFNFILPDFSVRIQTPSYVCCLRKLFLPFILFCAFPTVFTSTKISHGGFSDSNSPLLHLV